MSPRAHSDLLLLITTVLWCRPDHPTKQAAAGQVMPAVAPLLVAAGVEPATAEAVAAGRVEALPPLPAAAAAAATSSITDVVRLGSSSSNSAGPRGEQPPAAAADPRRISSYNAAAVLHRAAVETARLEGAPPPPEPNR